LTTEDGLPQSNITRIYQDQRGFIWLVTGAGIVHYDGENVTAYHPGNGYPFSLINRFLEIERDVFWLADYSSNIWEFVQEEVRPIEYMDPTHRTRTTDLARMPNGDIAVCTDGEGGYYIISEGKSQRFGRPDLNIPIDLNTIAVDSNGVILLGSDNQGVAMVDQGRVIARYTTQNILPSNQIQSISVFDDSEVWIGTLSGIGVIGRPEISEKFNQQFPDCFVKNIHRDPFGRTWISTLGCGNGLILYEDGLFTPIDGVLRPGTAPRTNCAKVLQDGTLLIGTTKGLVTIPNLAFSNYGIEDGLEDSYIKGITRDEQGTLWVGTKQSGLFARKGQRFEKVIYKQNSKFDSQVMALESGRGLVWVATQDGLFLFKDGVQVENSLTEFFANIHLRSVNASNPDEIFITGRLGLYRVNRDFEVEDISFNLKEQNFTFWGLARDAKGQLITVKNGRGAWKLIEKKWFPLEPNLKDPKGFAELVGINQAADGLLLLPSKNGGFSWDGEKVELIFDMEIPVWEMLKDKEGRLWVGTSMGLFRQDGETWRIFDRRMGLINTEFNLRSFYQEDDGTLWFGGTDGLNSFRDQAIDLPSFLSKPHITRIVQDSGQTLLPEDQVYTFQPKDNNLFIHYASPHFQNPGQVQYRYRLIGFHTEFSEATRSKVASYTNLGPGTYRFEVQSRIRNQVWPDEVSTFRFLVATPWYRTFWAYLLYALSMAAALWVLIKWRDRVMKARNRILEAKIADRTKDLLTSNHSLNKEIIARIEAEERLNQQKEDLTVTLKAIKEGVLRTDPDYRIVMLNREAASLLECEESNLIGQHISEALNLTEPDSGQKIDLSQSDFWEDLRNRPQHREKLMLNRSDDSLIWIDISCTEVKSTKGWGEGFVLVLRNIHRQQKDEEELFKAQKLSSVGILAGGIAHNFNNTLAGILGNTQLAQLAVDNPEKVSSFLSGIEKAAYNAKSLTTQLLTFARGGEPVKESFDLIQELEQAVTFTLSGKNVSVTYDYKTTFAPIHADRGQIHQVIHNLVINSCQAMPEGGRLHLTCEDVVLEHQNELQLQPGTFIKLELLDSGPGMNKDTLTRIFDPYFSTKEHGSGLGLTTCYAIIEKHDGAIQIHSEPGEGTRVIIFLPRNLHFQPKNLMKTESDILPHSRILFMDDEETIRELMQEMLRLMNCDVVLVEDGEEAVEAYKSAMAKQKFDLVILDWIVPGGMGGEAAISQILELDPDAKVIVSSGYSEQGALANYEQFGFVGILPKPYQIQDLKQVLQEHLKTSN